MFCEVNTYSVKKKFRNQKIITFIKFEFSVFDHSLRHCSYKNFYKNLSRCADFYLINEGPHNVRVSKIFAELKSVP
jgi:hypothetical protein